jgi:aryl-alcohol dehydrogenase-like predicted oxidoreductase
MIHLAVFPTGLRIIEEERMAEEKMGRRRFIQGLSTAIAGVATGKAWDAFASATPSEKSPPLEFRTLGRTGLKVTTVGMGVMNCSDIAVVLRAYDLGVNFFDTADCYMRGRNEEMVGKAFRGKRDRVFIQTKVHDGDEKKMRASVERSLRRLQTDTIDVLVWHGFSSADEVSNPAFQEFMVKMKKEGKARFTGFSSHSRMAPLLREAAGVGTHDVALVSYNFTHSKEMKEAVALAAKAGVGIVAMKTQSGGYKKERMEGLNPHQAALKYLLRDTNVATTVPGVTTIGEIEECAAVMGQSLSKRDLNEVKGYHAFLDGRICTLCGGCAGECPHGVPYGDLLRAVMYHDGYENDALAKEAVMTRHSLEESHRCLECPSCSVACRRGLDIRDQVQRARSLFA